jgi:dihydroflavonol-4-reductase
VRSVDEVLVVGGTGFIARWCLVQLLEHGFRVRTTVRDPSKEALVRGALAEALDAGDRLSFAVADLLDDAGWRAAVAGCRYVIHPASPLGGIPEDLLIATARDGALRVLRAATEVGVERVVLTSAANAASLSDYRQEGVSDETVWTDPDVPDLDPYRRSKTFAELAAWSFVESLDRRRLLTTVLPGAVFGPILGADNIGSVDVIGGLLRGDMPQVPRIGLEVVDVRDVADAHVRALSVPVAAGERFLATGELLWLPDIAQILVEHLGPDAARVSTEEIADEALAGLHVPGLGRRNTHTTAKAQELLAWSPRPAVDTVLDCAQSLLAHGVV